MIDHKNKQVYFLYREGIDCIKAATYMIAGEQFYIRSVEFYKDATRGQMRCVVGKYHSLSQNNN